MSDPFPPDERVLGVYDSVLANVSGGVTVESVLDGVLGSVSYGVLRRDCQMVYYKVVNKGE